ncbi:aspartyl protease family protein At5g10770-like [Cannabis sativa]|uniref:aspartyl protease family protein At5g10770-like n=1 Tax=Cannabis sativa TaxID=3483 RepID=UPI0029CA2D09|nr:aspartyl protease family protein At5g10770-like [Cannabis sativa]
MIKSDKVDTCSINKYTKRRRRIPSGVTRKGYSKRNLGTNKYSGIITWYVPNKNLEKSGIMSPMSRLGKAHNKKKITFSKQMPTTLTFSQETNGSHPAVTIIHTLVSYGDGSYTSGEIGSEHLKLGTTPVNGFVFGCGRNNKGLFGGASGLMGLGRSDLSLISQTDSLFKGVFSYCLPSSTEPNASGSLVMGFDSSTYKNSTPILFTKMVQNPQLPTFYFLNMTGISVGGVALSLSNSSSNNSFGKGGILIDSGTVITRLAPSVYKIVKEEFVKQFSGFPSAPGFSILDTCFNLSGYDQINLPTLKMQFDGNAAELSIDVTGVLYMVKTDASQICLALASLAYEEEIGIIGNYQQKNQRVIYDTKGSKLGFAEEICSFN